MPRLASLMAVVVLVGACNGGPTPSSTSASPTAGASASPGQVPAASPGSPETATPSSATSADCPSHSPLSVAEYVTLREKELEEGGPSCFGTSEVTLLGWADEADGIDFGPGGIEPGWLWATGDWLWDHACGKPRHGCPPYLFMHVNPDSGLRWDHTPRWVIVTGHVGDPLAETCRYVYPDDWPASPEPDGEAQDTCRASFVVTSVRRASAGLAKYGFARVQIPELNLRRGPSTSAERVMHPYGAGPVKYGTASQIDDLFILDGPVSGDGYVWWYVGPTEYLWEPYPPTGQTFILPNPTEPAFEGWVAAGDGENDWLVPVAGACPTGPGELGDVVYRVASWAVRMGCFRGQTLTLRGWIPIGEPRSIYLHEWMPGPVSTPDPEKAGLDRIDFEVYPVGLALPAPGQWVEITGQFDHPNIAETGPGCEEIADQVVCRSAFVATSVRALGSDP